MALHDELAREARLLRARRWFLRDCGVGLAGAALAALAAEARGGAADPLAPKAPHFPAKAKRVVYLFMAGAPSQLDLFDFKPELAKRNGQLPPKELLKDYRSAFIDPNSALLGPKYKFRKVGKCGAELCELLPQLAKVVDDIALVKSMHTDAVNHAPAQVLAQTGSQQFGRPTLGAWTLYGLGSASRDLPGYVVLGSGNGTSAGASNWGCGFLPTAMQGVPFRGGGDPVMHLSNPPGIDADLQRASLETLRRLNQRTLDELGDPETAARVQAYELAFRMQASAPELIDLSKESKETLELYGVDPAKPGFARNCLLARRLLERGVRFVQLNHEVWDMHGDLTTRLKGSCAESDRPAAALVMDLKRRGLLDDTLVVWGGEFGRTPMVQGGNDGRDHHNRAYTVWLAGGGVKPGLTLGATDDLGFNVVRDPVHVHDLNATILHLLGFDHAKLTYRFQGRDFRLTDVHGAVVRKLLA